MSLCVLGYSALVLHALQVGLATSDGNQNEIFYQSGCIAAIMVRAMLAAGIAVIFVVLLVVVLENAAFTLAMLRRALRHHPTTSV